MVSAICPRCRILLVEARSTFISDLAVAEQTAVAKGARFVSNSWGGGEFTGQDAYDGAFNHPGDAIVFAAGDFGYGTLYPGDTQYVTAVGGTKLVHRRSGHRTWTESVWSGTGSGCSSLEAKPNWQKADDNSPRGCLNRTENDLAADADPGTGVAVYDTYRTGIPAPIFEIGGTSVATAIITSVYALAGTPAKGSYPASYLYRHPSDFNDVTSGANGNCESGRPYLCGGRRGYDGPTGLGTPNGISGFSSRNAAPVTLVDPGTQDMGVGASVSVTVPAADTNSSARSLTYTASGLPAGVSIGSAPRSIDGIITGIAPATPGSYHVTVTARDSRTGRTGTTSFWLYVIPSMTALASNAPPPGYVIVAGGCLDVAALTVGTPVTGPGSCTFNAPANDWQFLSGATPGSPGELTISSGLCVGLSGSAALLQTCDGSAGQQWDYLPTYSPQDGAGSLLYNPASKECLDTGGTGPQAVIAACSAADNEESFSLIGVSVLDGRGQCLAASGNTAVTGGCAQTAQQSWEPFGGQLTTTPANALANTYCIAMNGTNDGVTAELAGSTSGVPCGQWIPGPDGELINQTSGKCLDAMNSGQALVQEDCYGQPGEIWALN
jgi:hypothetical protein